MRARLGFAFGFLGVLMVSVAAVGVLNLNRIRRDAALLVEEHHEANLTGQLFMTLQEIERLLENATDSPDAGWDAVTSGGHLERRVQHADALLEVVTRELDHYSPDRPHQDKEDRLVADIRGAMNQLQAALDAEDPEAKLDTLSDSLMTALVHSRDLVVETNGELADASKDLAQRSNGLLVLMVTTAFAAILLAVGTSLFVRRSIVKPLTALAEGTRRIGRGDFSHPIELNRRDELGDLAREFDLMASRVAQKQEELNRTIRTRTREFVRAARIAGLGTMAAGIAHEINNPLASIASCAEGLLRRLDEGELDAAEEADYLRTIAAEAYRAHETTARLLAYARHQDGTRDAVGLNDLIEEILPILQHRLDSKGIRMVMDLGKLPPLLGDAGELKQVILNLVTNAVDASPDGSEIRIATDGQNGSVVLEVWDEGIGLPEGEEERIFTPFYTTKPPGRGTGLGLAVAARVVEAHGGTIEAGRRPIRGSVFRVVLPKMDGEPESRPEPASRMEEVER